MPREYLRNKNVLQNKLIINSVLFRMSGIVSWASRFRFRFALSLSLSLSLFLYFSQYLCLCFSLSLCGSFRALAHRCIPFQHLNFGDRLNDVWRCCFISILYATNNNNNKKKLRTVLSHNSPISSRIIVINKYISAQFSHLAALIWFYARQSAIYRQ